MSTNIITRKGFDALKAELNELWRVTRPDVTQKVQWAASLGDRRPHLPRSYLTERLDRGLLSLSERHSRFKPLVFEKQFRSAANSNQASNAWDPGKPQDLLKIQGIS